MNGLIYKSSKEGLYYKKNEYKGIIQVCVHSFYWDLLGLKREGVKNTIREGGNPQFL